MPTEDRGIPPTLRVGKLLIVSSRLQMKVLSIESQNGRLLRISFQGKDDLSELYRLASPIQYSYQPEALKLWDVQTPLAQVPFGVEAPSGHFSSVGVSC